FDPNTTDVLETMDVFAMWEEAPQVTPTPIQPSQPTTSVTPKTSDNTNIGYQIGVLLISLSAVLILWKARNLVTK
ncbi:MAG: LPXTG cell wall anchor domain-containing protein, partial [Solobacterium sp.]|nr:LPXTG cell wall anchor domain-containing protein [Solobacterium sp.]